MITKFKIFENTSIGPGIDDYPFIYLADYEGREDKLKSIILNKKISF